MTSMPSSSSSASSPSLNSSHHNVAPSTGGARFNPLFMHTGGPHINLSNTNITYMASSNISPNQMQQRQEPPSRDVHVVYYLSRAGQLEHPHLLKVSVPPSHGLYLRDVKKRLAMIRGKRLPSLFAWSYKRSYKNGYVWQDLCDDDLIFPAHGCEYVIKGSELLVDPNNTADTEEGEHDVPSQNSTGEAVLAMTNNGAKHQEKQGFFTINPRLVYSNQEESEHVAANSVSLQVSAVESGTDAATQTEEELMPSVPDDIILHNQEPASKSSFYIPNHIKSSPKQLSNCSTHRASPLTATELNKSDISSPPSSSSVTNSPSPYKEIASTVSSSGFNMATGHNESLHKAVNDHIVARGDHNVGSKTPGRSWMRQAIQNLEEQDEIISFHTGGDHEVDNNVANTTSTNSAHEGSKIKHRCMAGNCIGTVIAEDVELPSSSPAPKPSKGKHSGALSFLQFMSCGGLDIKEQILPMSLYRLRSKGTPSCMAGQLHMSNYIVSPEHPSSEVEGHDVSERNKSWTAIRAGKLRSLYPRPPIYNIVTNDYNGSTNEVENQAHQSNHTFQQYCRHYPQHEGSGAAVQATLSSPMQAKISSGKLALVSRSVPDVISIGRSSISDRSTNASHELEYQVMDAHSKLRRSREIVANNYKNIAKGSPWHSTRPIESSHNNDVSLRLASARVVSGEILVSKGASPLFAPAGKRQLSYSGTPMSYTGFSTHVGSPSVSSEAVNNNIQSARKPETPTKSTLMSSSSRNPSRAFSEGEVSCMLAARNAMIIKSGDLKSATINGYDQSMAELWEELLAAPTTSTNNINSVQEEQQSLQVKETNSHITRVRQATIADQEAIAAERERTLQNAVDLSLQPPVLLHNINMKLCPQCGRKVKAELIKSHMKNCSSPKSTINFINCNNNNLGKSPKSDSNVCQQLL